MKLSSTAIEALRKTFKDKGSKLIKDDAVARLYIKISRAGEASWVQVEQGGGKRTEKVFGHYPRMALHEARARVVAVGGYRSRQPRSQLTIGAAIALYLEARVDEVTPGRHVELTRYLDVYLKALHKRPLETLTREEVATIVKAHKAEAPSAASHLQTAVKNFTKWCAQHEPPYITDDPLASMKAIVKRPESRTRVLDSAEIRALMSVRDDEVARILQFTLLTAQRIGEVTNIEESEINADHWWMIPAQKRKSGESNLVFLSPEAQEIYGDGLAEYSYHALRKWVKRNGGTWNIHDLRRTAATLMQEADVAPDVIERSLGHKVGDALRQTYQRSVMRNQVRAAFETLGKEVAKIVREKEVTPTKRK